MDSKSISKKTADLITLVLSGDYKLDGLELKPTRKLIRRQRKADQAVLDKAIKDVVVDVIDTHNKSAALLKETAYFSVKPASGSYGLLPFIQKAKVKATRDDVLRVITRMVLDDEIEKVGLKGGVEIPVEDANNFQIRYRSIRYAKPTTDEPAVFTENK
tara:strand:- start:130 stop:606 length:477 start_codon:yes stop_codon:yes gene_type:complete